MKGIKKLAALLTIGTLPMLCANAQVQTAVENQAYVLIGADIANAANATIQWYRNDVAIPGCTTQNCTVPAELCVGGNVRFYRKVTVTSTGETALVTFKSGAADDKCGGGFGTKIGDLCWANRNVDTVRTFVATPNDFGGFYQWNRSKGWAGSGASVSGWINTGDNTIEWDANLNPCPSGWRLPTRDEADALAKKGKAWVATDSNRGNIVNGVFLGPNSATCKLPDNMSGCIFLPASGYRENNRGQLTQFGKFGMYWTSSKMFVETSAIALTFSTSGTVSTNSGQPKVYGLSVRCVQ